MSINTLILSLILKNYRFGSDVRSVLRRYQSLSIIYINFSLSGVMILYELIIWLQTNSAKNQALMTILALLMTTSLILLRRGRLETSALIVVLNAHLINIYAAEYGNQPVAALYGLMIIPSYCFFLSQSWKVGAVNLCLSIAQVWHHFRKIRYMFEDTLSDEQAYQIETLYSAVNTCLTSISVIYFIQKSIEVNLWKMLQSTSDNSENLTKEVLQAVKAKDAFVSSLSHEIRNPLHALTGSVDYLLDVLTSSEHLRIIQHAKLSIEILKNLANNVLDAAKLKSDKMDISLSESKFIDIIKKVLTINSEAIKMKKIFVEAHIDRHIPQTMWMDPSRLLQIMMNLTSNALKFTPEGGRIKMHVSWCTEDHTKDTLLSSSNVVFCPRPAHEMRPTNALGIVARLESLTLVENFILRGARKIKREETNLIDEAFSKEMENEEPNIVHPIKLFETRASQVSKNNNSSIAAEPIEPWTIKYGGVSNLQGQQISTKGYLKVEVSDTGCGIAEESIGKLFEMFVQAHQSVNQMHGGTGLGLWICKQLCQRMGGDIKLYSKLNYGTSFVFYIPINNDKRANQVPVNQILSRDYVNVLVVDDYAHNRELHKLLLQREGAHVTLASDGREAVEKYTSKDEGFYDFILLDVLMPDIGGLEAAKMIRQWEKTQKRRNVDIYFITGEYFSEDDLITEFKQVIGVDGIGSTSCLRKPIEVEAVRNITRRYMSNSSIQT